MTAGKTTSEHRPSAAGKPRVEVQFRPRLLIPVGIPGSGKSSWARKLIADAGRRHQTIKMISSDAIRLRLAGSLLEANQPQLQAMLNELVFTIFNLEIKDLLAGGETVIADATNLHSASRKQLLEIAAACGVDAEIVLFDDLDRARAQNRARSEDAVVPDRVITEMEELYHLAKAEIENDSRLHAAVSVVS